MTIIFRKENPITLQAMFGLMAFASAAFECRSVMCREFLPNLDVRLGLKKPPLNDEATLKQAWHETEIALLAWLDLTPAVLNGKISLSDFELELFQSGSSNNGVLTFVRHWIMHY
jgi:hypothetical protein